MKDILKSEHFVYYAEEVTNIEVKPYFCIARIDREKPLLKICLFGTYNKKMQKLVCTKDSPKHLKNISKSEKQEILATLKFKEDFEFSISNYEKLLISWNKLNPANEEFYETPLEEEGYWLTPFDKEDTNLPMIVNLRCIHFEDENEIFLRFQNDRKNKINTNYVKMLIDGTIINKHNQEIVFDEDELNQLRAWVKQNREIIKRHWNGKIDSITALETCKKYEVQNE